MEPRTEIHIRRTRWTTQCGWIDAFDEVSCVFAPDATGQEMMEAFAGLMMAAGYAPETVAAAAAQYGEEHEPKV